MINGKITEKKPRALAPCGRSNGAAVSLVQQWEEEGERKGGGVNSQFDSAGTVTFLWSHS